jgi:ABC-type bacteriocin/lantibiotic exporter with double-glycine peptidase domain
LRLGVLLPPLAGLTRTIFELIRSGPMLATLEPCLDERATAPGGEREGAPSGPAEIRFERVNFAFGNTPVLQDLSFVWKPGDVIGIRGPNGSGKSTLLRLVLGLIEPNAGNVLIGGVEARRIDWTSWRKNITYLPQRPYVPDGFSVHETMQLTLPSLTSSQSRAALILTGAWDHLLRCSAGKVEPLEVPMSQLSVGVRQRVLLARTFAQPANLTLLDEPDENLDQPSRALLMDLVKKLGPSRTIIIATHDRTLLAGTSTVLDLTSSGAVIRTQPPPPASGNVT